MGAQIQPVTDQDYQTLGLQKPEGLRIIQVVGGTAKNLNLLPDDVLLSVNGQPTNTPADLTAYIPRQLEGAAVSLRVWRNRQQTTLKGTFAGRPKETDDLSETIYDSAPYKGGRLSVIINRPRKPGKLPAVLFIPGYTCSSVDGLSANHPYKRIVKGFGDAGYVVLRIEKSGLGSSQNTPPCQEMDLKEEIANFEQGLLKLKTLSYVDTQNILIFGHSMGGIVAPAISARHQVKGVMVYGTTAKSWYEYQLELNRLQSMLGKPDPMAHEAYCREQEKLAHQFFIEKKSLSQMAADPQTDTLLRAGWEYDGKGHIFSRNAEYWRQIQDMPLLENWQKTRAKVLVMFGESDFQAFSRADHEQIAYTVNYYRPKTATFRSFAQTDHYFAKSGSMQEAYDLFAGAKYTELFNLFNPQVISAAVQWADETVYGPQPDYTWQKLNTEAYAGKQDDIAFVNEQIGWYVNGYGRIFKTTDGGNTWTKQLEKQGSFFRCVAFIDSLRGFVGTVGTDYFPNVTDTIPLYQTTDGGKTWQPVAYKGPYIKGLCAIDIVRETFVNHGKPEDRYHIYAVGRVGSPAGMIVSHDGGKTWTSSDLSQYGKMFFDITMFDKNVGIACSASDADVSKANALILRTEDGGKTWTKVYQSARPYELTWKASFPTPQIGYVTIQSYNPDPNVKQQRIAKTTDGGKTWVELPLCEDAQAREFGVGFLNEKQGFVGTMTSGYQTKDGGLTWEKVDLGRACNKIRIYRHADRTWGYAIGVQVMKLVKQ